MGAPVHSKAADVDMYQAGPQGTTDEQSELLVRSAESSSHTLLLQHVVGLSGSVVSKKVVGSIQTQQVLYVCSPTVSLWVLALDTPTFYKVQCPKKCMLG